MIAYKMVRPNLTDWRTGSKRYEVGSVVEEALCDGPDAGACGRGLHVAVAALEGARNGREWGGCRGSGLRPWRFLEVELDEGDIIARDAAKIRVRKLRVVRELSFSDVFGFELGPRLEALQGEIASWRTIPWFAPARRATDDEICALVAAWRGALATWHASLPYKRVPELPTAVRIVRDPADAAAAAAAAAGGAFKRLWPYWLRWYVRPYYAMWRAWRWHLVGMQQPSPWDPLVELYRLGCAPLGYVRGEFVVYAPSPMCAADGCDKRMREEAGALVCDCGAQMALDEGAA